MCPLEEDDGDGAEGLEVGGEEVEVGGGAVSLLTPSAVVGCMGTVVKPPLLGFKAHV